MGIIGEDTKRRRDRRYRLAVLIGSYEPTRVARSSRDQCPAKLHQGMGDSVRTGAVCNACKRLSACPGTTWKRCKRLLDVQETISRALQTPRCTSENHLEAWKAPAGQSECRLYAWKSIPHYNRLPRASFANGSGTRREGIAQQTDSRKACGRGVARLGKNATDAGEISSAPTMMKRGLPMIFPLLMLFSSIHRSAPL